MNQDERWIAKYNEVVEFIETNHRNPSKRRIEEHDMLNWLKANRQALNAGKMKVDRGEKSEKERSQNLRLIHVTKQAALTHIYGYTENAKKNSLWSKIKSIDEVGIERLDTEGVEKTLEELTKDLAADNQKSRIYAHYRYKENFYIPNRLDAFGKMLHATELEDSLKLLNVCKCLDKYTYELLRCIHDNQEQERKKQYDEWMGKIDQLVVPMAKDEKTKDALNPLRDLVELVYGDKMR